MWKRCVQEGPAWSLAQFAVNRESARALEQWRAITGARHMGVRKESGFVTQLPAAMEELLHFQSCRG